MLMSMSPEEGPSAARVLSRWPYFWWGCGLMAIKYNLDRLIAWWGFHRQWYFWNYIKPHGYLGIVALPPEDATFYYLMLLTALPFVAVGIVLTLRRLRSAGLPLALCLLFFVPIINLTFFLTLCVIPAQEERRFSPLEKGWFSYLPTSSVGCALLSALIVGTCGAVLACLSTEFLRNYGWGLFVGEPFAMGLVSVLIYAGPAKRSFGSCLVVALLTTLFVGICLLIAAVEGFICLIMAAPIGCALSLLGGIVGYLIAGNWHAPVKPVPMLLVLLAVPFSMGMEKQADIEPPLLSVTSSIVIDAPPEKVWSNVIAFSPIPEQRDWVLHTGIAYPTRARIDGQGVGAVRHCIFTTGEFVEPIEVWDEPHCLRFSVAAQPEPMEELSPYPHLKTTHLDNYFMSREGELRLTALPEGKTLLSGTTWYTDRIWPSAYWQLWSDMMIHHIHLRVLDHIKNASRKIGASSKSLKR